METPAAPEQVTDEVKPIVGMVHVGALPGTPRHHFSMGEIVDAAVADAKLYQECGVHCLMIENMHDVPYTRGSVGPEIVAGMTLVAQAVRAQTALPVGLQVLAGADIEAIAIAHAASLDFIRAECFAFAHVADEGIFESNAAKLLRYRRMIGATAVQVWADIKKKHASHALTADLTLGDAAEAAEFMGAETIIVTGPSTGRPPTAAEVQEARDRCGLAVFVGSGVSLDNLAELLAASDGLIIGSHFKQEGRWDNAPDRERVRRFMAAVNELQPVSAMTAPDASARETATAPKPMALQAPPSGLQPKPAARLPVPIPPLRTAP